MPTNLFEMRTEHCLIHSSATRRQTELVAGAAEALCRAYPRALAGLAGFDGQVATLRLRLYRDRAEFRRLCKVTDWAEAVYQGSTCHAYISAEAANPYHWMLHEATHQLNRESAHVTGRQWVDEGLASYFGASVLDGGELRVGRPDAHAYPVWWLGRMKWSGDLAADSRKGRVIPLRAIVTSRGGPPMDKSFNLYYMEWWSLTHFLMESGGGKYRAGYLATVADGGTLESFERNIGPIKRIEAEWYGHLLGLKGSAQ